MQPGQFVTDASQNDLGQHFGGVQGKGIYITFHWVKVKLQSVDPAKNGKFERRLRIIKQPVGDPNSASASYIKPEAAQKQYPLEWDYFTKHGDMPLTGTALSELPGISMSQIQMMQLAGLRSIEDILSVRDEVINSIGYEGRVVLNVAREWQARKDENAEAIDYAETKAAQDAALQAANSRADAADAQNRELLARIEAMEKLMSGSGAAQMAIGHQQEQPMGMGRRDEGADIDDTPNPLADGNGDLDDESPI